MTQREVGVEVDAAGDVEPLDEHRAVELDHIRGAAHEDAGLVPGP
jgi:hypothetical protein